jgi:hypothetical protein
MGILYIKNTNFLVNNNDVVHILFGQLINIIEHVLSDISSPEIDHFERIPPI